MATTEPRRVLGDVPDRPAFAWYDPRRITHPGPLFPLAVLFGLNAVDELDRVAFGVLLPDIRDWFGISLTGVGFLVAAIVPLALLIELPIGYLGDRRNRTRLALLGASLWAGFSLLTGLAWNIGVLAVARMGSAIGRTSTITHRSLLSDHYPTEARAKVFYAYSVANSVGQIAGPLAAGFLAAAFAWRTPFVLFVIPTLLLILVGLRLQEPTRGVNERLEAGADQAAAHLEDDPPGFAETFRVLFSLPTAKRIYYALPFLTVSVFGLLTFISLFYSDIYDVGPAGRGIIFAAVEPVQIAGLVIGGVMGQRFVNRSPGLAMRLLAVSAVGTSIGLVILALSPTIGVAIVGHMLASFTSAMIFPGALAAISFVIPARMRTLGFATGNLWLLLGVPFLPIVGAVGDAVGLRAGLLLAVPIYLVGSFLLASAGFTIEEDIERVRMSDRVQAEMRLSREQGEAKLLIARDVDVAYDGVQVLFGVDLEVTDGEIVALLGTNGAGKSTLLKAISGLVPVTGGTIMFDGRAVTNADPVQVARAGIAQIPGGRAIFPSLTVEENLRVAAWMYRGDKEHTDAATEQIVEHFPVLKSRWNTPAGDLSGGEQQMLSLAQAFISKPDLLLIDELTLGLAPTVVERLLEIVQTIHAQGTTIVLVEQSVNIALKLAQRAVFLEKGEVRFEGPTADLLERPDVLRSVFLEGAASADGGRPAAKKAKRTAPAADAPVVLSVTHVSKRFGGVTAVDDVDLELRDGEILGIIGPNGAGKTTLFDLLTGFQPVDSGTVELHGVDVTERAASARTRDGLGRSFQDARLWSSLTVSESIAVAHERSVEERSPIHAMAGLPVVHESEEKVERHVEELIELLGLTAFRDKFVNELSTGSRRIVEIAAIMAHKPSVLLLDEPSSGIAQKETEALGPLLLRVREFMDGSMIVVEHNVPLIASLADRLLAMDLGGVIAVGTPDEVLHDPQVVESYLGTSAYTEIVGTKPARRRRR